MIYCYVIYDILIYMISYTHRHLYEIVLAFTSLLLPLPPCPSFTLVGLLIFPQIVPLLLSCYIYIYLDLDFPYERKHT